METPGTVCFRKIAEYGRRKRRAELNISASRKRVFGGLYRRICAREHMLRMFFVIY